MSAPASLFLARSIRRITETRARIRAEGGRLKWFHDPIITWRPTRLFWVASLGVLGAALIVVALVAVDWRLGVGVAGAGLLVVALTTEV